MDVKCPKCGKPVTYTDKFSTDLCWNINGDVVTSFYVNCDCKYNFWVIEHYKFDHITISGDTINERNNRTRI